MNVRSESGPPPSTRFNPEITENRKISRYKVQLLPLQMQSDFLNQFFAGRCLKNRVSPFF